MNILVIGNGFDLAHGLPTRYTDFLKWIEVILQVINVDPSNSSDSIDWKNINTKIKNQIEKNKSKILFRKKIWMDLFENNIWISYFFDNATYLSENWIDFESEISKIIQTLEFDLNDSCHNLDDSIEKLSNNFLNENYKDFFRIKNPRYKTNVDLNKVNNRITFRKLRDKLIKDLNRLIKALEIYLIEYIEVMECGWLYSDIKKNIPDKVLSFNYTNTYERLYGGNRKIEYDYIHGKAISCNIGKRSNIVLGINEYLTEERKDKNLDFIAFKKFYQRIYKETGNKYKEWIDTIRQYGGSNHNLSIFGHSLDITDKDILRDFILNDNVLTTIFYLNKDVMGQQIANLVKIIGQDELIRKTGGIKKTIEFKQQLDEIQVKRIY